MVKFLNQKEDVIKLELTPYGKQKFSTGGFLPEYYAFYDTDIIYDASYVNMSESQNSIVTRITTETPRLAPFVWQSSSASPVQSKFSLNTQNDFYQTNDYSSQFMRFIGTSSPWADYAPSWNIKVIDQSSVAFKDSLAFTASNLIPIMSASLLMKYDLEGVMDEPEEVMYILTDNENITLDVQELNTLFKVNGNFEVEILKIDDSGRKHLLGFIDHESEYAQDLSQQSNPSYLANTLLGTNEHIIDGFPILDESYVEYYLDIQLDQSVSGVRMPNNSTIYKRNLDRNPGDLCDIENSDVETPLDWGRGEY